MHIARLTIILAALGLPLALLACSTDQQATVTSKVNCDNQARGKKSSGMPEECLEARQQGIGAYRK